MKSPESSPEGRVSSEEAASYQVPQEVSLEESPPIKLDPNVVTDKPQTPETPTTSPTNPEQRPLIDYRKGRGKRSHYTAPT